jgi:uncharacterized OB-fold protein
VAPEGVIEAFTTIHVAPESFEIPYAIGYARLDAGPRMLVRFDRGDAMAIKRKARVIVRPAEIGALPTAQPTVAHEG